ncbi:MAG: MBOAT family protein [Kiritimatiellae bacterium]|nr:MBOAT family protein [Kiritimatiellia bacterium]
MSFIDYQFLLFFPLVTLVFFAIRPASRWIWLLAASCWFYMAFVPVYIFILAAIVCADWLAALGMAHCGPAPSSAPRRACLLAGTFFNLGILVFYKYWNFLAANWDALAVWTGCLPKLPATDVILPIGLSFVTFQTLAYLIEVYRGTQPVERHLGRFATYVMFYPQLVAGPIERPGNLLAQLRRTQVFDTAEAAAGLELMLWGFFKKVVVADRLAEFVDAAYASPAAASAPAAILAAYFFAFQIYCDFSGYTDIARGAGRVMGFDIILNFRRPYFSRSVGEFWRRWHISLSSWFRDYLYIPLGGNRVTAARWAFNTMVVFLASGLWHGAAWTFVVWGGLHGLFLLCSRATDAWRRRACAFFRVDPDGPLRNAVRTVLTFHLVTAAWVFFRAPTWNAAMAMFRRMAGGATAAAPSFTVASTVPSGLWITLSALAVLVLAEAFAEFGHAADRWRRLSFWIKLPIYVALVLCVMNLGVPHEKPFIYFQF